MKKTWFKYLLLFGINIISVANIWAQQISIKLGDNRIFEDEFYSIHLIISNGKVENYGNFPDIEGFVKDKIESNASSDPNEIVKPLIITQKYYPEKSGKYYLSDFSIKVNGKLFSSKGCPIIVLENKEEPKASVESENFIIKEEHLPLKEPNLVYALSKKNVFEREQLYVALLVLIPDNCKTVLKFTDLNNQLQKIIQKLKPQNCTQETILNDSITKGIYFYEDQKFTYFKLYETVLFPISGNTIELPSQQLIMLNAKKEENTNLTAKAIVVNIKKLPDHPLKNKVPVGNFQLQESVSNAVFRTGKGFNYQMNISGLGNFTTVEKPQMNLFENIQVYEPEINLGKQVIENQKVKGNITFNYFMIPQEPGQFLFKNHFSLIFFNTSKEKYDTLHSKLIANVSGEIKKNLGLSLSSDNEYYKLMKNENNFFINKNADEVYLLLGKVVLVIMLILLGILMIKL